MILVEKIELVRSYLWRISWLEVGERDRVGWRLVAEIEFLEVWLWRLS